MKIGINLEIIPHGHSGGVEQFLIGLVKSLGELEGEEEYILFLHPNYPNWLNKYIGKNQKIVTRPITLRHKLQKLLGNAQPILNWYLKIKKRKKAVSGVRVSKGWFESHDLDVIHFPYQDFVLTKIPSIFNPHDIQHEHFPEFFDPESLKFRKSLYPKWCQKATYVVSESEFVKNDLIKRYDIQEDKIKTIYRGAPTDLYESVATSKGKSNQKPPPSNSVGKITPSAFLYNLISSASSTNPRK